MIESLRLDRAPTRIGVRIDLRDWKVRMHALFTSTRCRLMGGHWRVLHTSRNHIALRCVACGHTSPGWHVGKSTGERSHVR
jgi:hypothetical protein